MSIPSYAEFFETLTGHAPFPYQTRLAAGEWPEVLDVPTGLGKTQAVLAAWLHRLLRGDGATGRRLIYCLPMRVLVGQTLAVAETACARAAPAFVARDLRPPTVHALLGGYVDEAWELVPEQAAVLVGTQDMLLSRALARGYVMSPYKWPVHFGLLHSDCLWVLDETQLMGVAVETSAQLDGLRRQLGTLGPSHTLWMSATLGREQLATVDHPLPSPQGFRTLSLDERDHESPVVRRRLRAAKPLIRAFVARDSRDGAAYAKEVAALAGRAHATRGGLTLVILNRVDRAQAVYRLLRDQLKVSPLALVHSRFRPGDRGRHEVLLQSEGDRTVVATQAVEAGVDVSARTLISELAPWPSMVQRFGRLNRYGEEADARIEWIDLNLEGDESLALPYSAADLAVARDTLYALSDAGLQSLGCVAYQAPLAVRPVLRRRDLVDLFDTSPDLLGNEVDVSRFVRDGEDTDVHVLYREFDGNPEDGVPAPGREEVVRVSLAAARVLLERLSKKRAVTRTSGDPRHRLLRAWTPAGIGSTSWRRCDRVQPGQVLLLHAAAGGYDTEVGWTGEVLPRSPVPVVPGEVAGGAGPLVETMDADPRTSIDRWIPLPRHLADVRRTAHALATAVGLDQPLRQAVETAALWHDVGKAHPEFQRRLVDPVAGDPALAPPGPGPWAKSAHVRRAPTTARPCFRHELASALAWLQAGEPGPHHDLIAFLIAAHHGKVRLSIRSVPDERRPPESDRLFARGVWHGDELPAVDLGNGSAVGPLRLDLSPMVMGEGSWLERTLALRDTSDLGPFRLAYLEAIVRVADWRASAEERLHA